MLGVAAQAETVPLTQPVLEPEAAGVAPLVAPPIGPVAMGLLVALLLLATATEGLVAAAEPAPLAAPVTVALVVAGHAMALAVVAAR